MKRDTTKRTELQRLLSKRGFASRSQASILIRAGKVRVNNKIERDPLKYIPLDSEIEVEGIGVKTSAQIDTLLIAFHKPKGVVTTSSDEKGRKTVYDVLPKEYRHLKAIGRLDMATTGLLLFTNDNSLADMILSPTSRITKCYVVTVRGMPGPEALGRLEGGISDRGEKLRASSVTVRKASKRETILIVTLTEGKNREIRRMCKAIGHEVMALKRISIGNIELGNLAPGATREIDPSVIIDR